MVTTLIYHGELLIVCIIDESLSCLPETNIILYITVFQLSRTDNKHVMRGVPT